MSISGKFMDSGSPAAFESLQRLREARQGEDLYKTEFALFCETIGMTIGELQKLPPNMVLTIMLLKMFNLLSAKIIQLDARLAAAEGQGAGMQPVKEPLQ